MGDDYGGVDLLLGGQSETPLFVTERIQRGAIKKNCGAGNRTVGVLVENNALNRLAMQRYP